MPSYSVWTFRTEYFKSYAILARLDQVQEELLHYLGLGVGVHTRLEFYFKDF